MATRKQNETRFANRKELPDGGRRYWQDYYNDEGGWARITKIVDKDEVTVEVFQEIFNRSGKRLALHEKYPVDKGHIWFD